MKNPKAPEEEKPRGKKPPPDPDHLGWSIDGRRQNQHAALRLYRLFIDKKVTGFGYESQQLVAIAFSLWRAVFLADRTGEMESRSDDARDFLGKMLTDNAITFAQDRENREWTFNYYIQDTNHRIKALYEEYRMVPAKEIFPRKGQRSAQARWALAQSHFEILLDILEKKIAAAEVGAK